MFLKIKQFLLQEIKLEKQNLRYLYIITFALGILSCFFTQENNRYILLIIITICLFFNLLFYSKNESNIKYKIIFNFITMFLIGFISAYIKCIKIEQTNFKQPEYNITIIGKVENIKLSSNKTLLTLRILKSPNTILVNKKVKIQINDDLKIKQNITNENILKIKTSLIPIKYGNFPNDKSYENYAKFFDIIASGTAKKVELLNNKKYDKYYLNHFNIQNIRNNIQKRIYNINNHSDGAGIIIAILTGNNSFISKEKLNNIRHSGCAHILAISGLHMSILIAFVFFIFIHIFALFPKIALKYNTKKLAILPAILTCFFYINIANIPISALRSFLMIFITAIILIMERPKSSLNTLFIVFFIILLFAPDYILSPSFQMSFMAVFGLTTFYNNNFLIKKTSNYNHKKILNYIFGIPLSSIVATISTIFFEIYHFKQYAWIGLVSNMPVIPLTEFLILPISFIGMLFNNTIIGDFCYKFAGFFANIVCTITDYTSHLPNSFLLAKQMTNLQLSIIIFGIILLFLSISKLLKITGFICIIYGIICYLTDSKYVLLYNSNLKNIIFLEKNKYYSFNEINNQFLYSIITQNLGINKIYTMNKDNKNLRCIFNKKNSLEYCIYYINNKKYVFYKEKSNQIIGVKFIKNNFKIII